MFPARSQRLFLPRAEELTCDSEPCQLDSNRSAEQKPLVCTPRSKHLKPLVSSSSGGDVDSGTSATNADHPVSFPWGVLLPLAGALGR